MDQSRLFRIAKPDSEGLTLDTSLLELETMEEFISYPMSKSGHERANVISASDRAILIIIGQLEHHKASCTLFSASSFPAIRRFELTSADFLNIMAPSARETAQSILFHLQALPS
jgi:hypothetical protein